MNLSSPWAEMSLNLPYFWIVEFPCPRPILVRAKFWCPRFQLRTFSIEIGLNNLIHRDNPFAICGRSVSNFDILPSGLSILQNEMKEMERRNEICIAQINKLETDVSHLPLPSCQDCSPLATQFVSTSSPASWNVLGECSANATYAFCFLRHFWLRQVQ